jgi:hypothetical protein
MNQKSVIRDEFSQRRNARYRWGVPGRCHSHFTLEAHSHRGFVLQAPAATRMVHRGIGLCEAVPALTEITLVSCAVRQSASSHGQVPELAAARIKTEVCSRPPAVPAAALTIDGARMNQLAGLGQGRNYPLPPGPARQRKPCRRWKNGKNPPKKSWGQVP